VADLIAQVKQVASILSVGVLLLPCPVRADFCKWVDEQGVTHYATECPDHIKAQEIETQPPPSQQQVEEADRRSEQWLQQLKSRREQATAARSLSFDELGPLPENEKSQYISTTATGISFNLLDISGRFSISLKANSNLPPGAYLEARFPNPSSGGNAVIVGKALETAGSKVMILSPEFKGFKCWNYTIRIDVYADKSKTELLGTHHQSVQSRVDLDKVRGAEDLTMAMDQGNCTARPAPKKKMSVEDMEASCEREREKRIGPQREALIKRCVKIEKKDPQWCAQFYSDHGAAKRVSTYQMRPPLYYNLPECVEARKAREATGSR
jgi:hypothetical protein